MTDVQQKVEYFFDFFPWKFDHAAKLEQFRNIHAGKSCIIIGNGPSLNKMDLSLITDCYTFGLNKIYLMYEKIDLQLNYLVSVNKFVIEQSVDKYNDFPCPIFLSYTASKGLEFNADNIYYLHTGNFKGFYSDLCRPINEGYTVTYVAAQIAYFMGFEKVYLIGVDHSFKQQGRANEVQTLKQDDENHFDPRYFAGNQWQLADLENSEEAYKRARSFYEKNGRNIYDATVGGKLTVFEKVDFEEAISNARI